MTTKTKTTTATDEKNQGTHGKGGGLIGREFGPTGRKDDEEKPSPQEQAFELAEALKQEYTFKTMNDNREVFYYSADGRYRPNGERLVEIECAKIAPGHENFGEEGRRGSSVVSQSVRFRLETGGQIATLTEVSFFGVYLAYAVNPPKTDFSRAFRNLVAHFWLCHPQSQAGSKPAVAEYGSIEKIKPRTSENHE